MKSIYLAGKVSKNDWRHSLVEGLRDKLLDSIESHGVEVLDSCWAIEGQALGKMKASVPMMDNKATYVGPILIADDHGCYHGDTQHGAIVLDKQMATERNGESLQRKGLFKANSVALESADIVIAYIESIDCFGTLAEIGHAFGRKIPVHIIYEENFHKELSAMSIGTDGKSNELWYIEEMSETVTIAREGTLYVIVDDIITYIK